MLEYEKSKKECGCKFYEEKDWKDVEEGKCMKGKDGRLGFSEKKQNKSMEKSRVEHY